MKKMLFLGLITVVVTTCLCVGFIKGDLLQKESGEGIEVEHLSKEDFVDEASKEQKYYDYMEERIEERLGSLEYVKEIAVDISIEENKESEGVVSVKYECEDVMSEEELQQWKNYIQDQLGNELIVVSFEHI